MASPDGIIPAARRPFVRRLMLRDFRSYAALDLAIDGRLVVLCGENGAGKTNLLEALSLLAPGRGLRRAELADCARVGGAGGFALSVEVETDGETRQLGSGWSPGEGGPERRIRIDRAPVASSRAFSDHVRVVWLTPAMDSLFSGPASERRRFLDRFVLAIDPSHGARVGQFERALSGRNRLLEEGGAQRFLARRDRARGGRARRRGRRRAARMREPARGADRGRARRRLALPFCAARASKARWRRSRRTGRRWRPKTAIAPSCATIAAATPPRGGRWSARMSATSPCGTGRRTPRRRSPRPESRRRCWSGWCSPMRGWWRTWRASRRSRSSTRSRRISIRAGARRCSTRSSRLGGQVFLTGADPAAFADLEGRAQMFEVPRVRPRTINIYSIIGSEQLRGRKPLKSWSISTVSLVRCVSNGITRRR